MHRHEFLTSSADVCFVFGALCNLACARYYSIRIPTGYSGRDEIAQKEITHSRLVKTKFALKTEMADGSACEFRNLKSAVGTTCTITGMTEVG